jgi:aromatic-L-amino-acid/L-tryptophan decarboxylase
MASAIEKVAKHIDMAIASDKSDAVGLTSQWEDLREDLPQHGIGFDATVNELIERVLPYGNRMSDPGFLGWITSGPTVIPTLAATAASFLSPQRSGISAFNLIEEMSLEWLAQLCGLPDGMKGVYSSGGSTANLVALGAARQHALVNAGIDPSAVGLDGRPTAIYASTEAHHTIGRSAAVLGLGRRSVRQIPIDSGQHIRPDDLASIIDEDLAKGVIPIAIVASAGTTNTGAIDPIDRIGEIAKHHGIWFHVDGAYGLPGILDERVAERYRGLNRADSAIVDPHKWLGAPVGIGATFVRDRGILFDAFTQEPADYLEGSFVPEEDVQTSFDSMGIPYSEFGVELSAPSRGIQVWAILKEIGVDGMRTRVKTDNDFASYTSAFAEEHPKLESLTTPELSIACFRYVDSRIENLNSFNQKVLLEVRRTTRYIVSSTVVNGQYAIRPCYINARTTQGHVDEFLNAVVEVGDALAYS